MVKQNSIWHGIGLGIFLSIVLGTLLGWLGLTYGFMVTILIYIVCYIPAGFLVAKLNPNHPYTLSAIAGIILSGLNQLVSIYMQPGILGFPLILHFGILIGVLTSLLGACMADRPWRYFYKRE
ncbi:hypothetical protein [Lentibacillus saliphilus]|uniref:hypothetical protein n=1 Tax=Lentibacillus saliphilus TaxID=2737028 RepID=UPI001C309CDE|nr:hypothetical protein [Lentibacillus saliphilus]